MNQTLIFWPMMAHVLLVYIVYGVMSRKRIAAVRAGRVKAAQFRDNIDEPQESLWAKNNLANQFELPTLFHVIGVTLYVTGGVTMLTLILAWLFVASRYIHSWVHITTNKLRHRRPIFMLGYMILGAIWIVFAAQLAFNIAD
jgi:hypothetical protein